MVFRISVGGLRIICWPALIMTSRSIFCLLHRYKKEDIHSSNARHGYVLEYELFKYSSDLLSGQLERTRDAG